MVALLTASVMVVIPLQWKGAEDALHLNGLAALERLSGFGLIVGIGPIRRFLKQPADQRICGFENGRAHQDLPLGVPLAVQRLGFKTRDQLPDFFFPGKEDGGRERICFFAAAMFRRVSSMTRSAYCSVSCRYWA